MSTACVACCCCAWLQRVVFLQDVQNAFHISAGRDLAHGGLVPGRGLAILALLHRAGRAAAVGPEVCHRPPVRTAAVVLAINIRFPERTSLMLIIVNFLFYNT